MAVITTSPSLALYVASSPDVLTHSELPLRHNHDEPSHHYRHAVVESPKSRPLSLNAFDAQHPGQYTKPGARSSRPAHIRSLTISSLNEIMALDVVPNSPPQLSSSKSSTKSSSLHSSNNHLPDNLADFSHFEDVSLSDNHRDYPQVRNVQVRPLLRPTQTTPSPRSSRSSSNIRDLTNGTRHTGLVNTHLRGLNGQSSNKPSLHKALPRRSPVPLGLPQSNGQRTPNLSHSSTPMSPRSPATPSANLRSSTSQTFPSPKNFPRSRRGSLQAQRKTAEEIERDYDDSDDEVPEDAYITNVPMSPRPPQSRSQSRSPERKELKQISSPNGEGVSRIKSWDMAMSALSTEVKALTNKLEEYADENGEPISIPNSRPSSRHRPSLSAHRAKTLNSLPPLQRGDNLIDPLPASKEKERFLSRTRPSWLPPKCQKEERKHLKEYQRMMTSFLDSETRKSAQEKSPARTKTSEETTLMKTWQDLVLANWNVAKRDPATRELWWRGVPLALKGQAWAKAIGNELHLNLASYHAALTRAKAVEKRLASVSDPTNMHDEHRGVTTESKSDGRARRSLVYIDADISSTYSSLGIFQSGQARHEELRDLLIAYAAYREDTGHVHGTAGIAALLLIHMPPVHMRRSVLVSENFTTPNQIITADASDAFIALANLLNRPASLAFCLGDASGKDRIYRQIMRAMEHKIPTLHKHFTHLTSKDQPNNITGRPARSPSPNPIDRNDQTIRHDLVLDDILGPLCQSLFTSHLQATDAARLWDVLISEGDTFIARAVLGILSRLEGRLYGGPDDILRVLGRGQSQAELALGGEAEVMSAVRWAGRSPG